MPWWCCRNPEEQQVVIYNHMARGGKAKPTGKWKGLVELPNTVSKMTSMQHRFQNDIHERSGRNSFDCSLQRTGR
jgi:hypothetical protein